jgi:hypothetical protein
MKNFLNEIVEQSGVKSTATTPASDHLLDIT